MDMNTPDTEKNRLTNITEHELEKLEAESGIKITRLNTPDTDWERELGELIAEYQYGRLALSVEVIERVTSLLTAVRVDWLRSEIEKLEGEIKPETKIEDCENCGEEGYGKAWFGRGRETGDAWGDRYTPTGSVVFCKNCKPEFRIGKDWNGEEIWKTTSDDPQHDTLRINCITKTVNKEWNQALTSIITRYKEELKVLESK